MTQNFKFDMKNLTNFYLSTQKFQKLNRLLLKKVYHAWAKKVQRTYVSWHWRVMQNLKKNWLMVWKITWVIWGIITRALESLKIEVGSFYPKQKMYKLNIYKGTVYHGNKQWCKIWREIDLSFWNWHHNLPDFDPINQMSQKWAPSWAFKQSTRLI